MNEEFLFGIDVSKAAVEPHYSKNKDVTRNIKKDSQTHVENIVKSDLNKNLTKSSGAEKINSRSEQYQTEIQYPENSQDEGEFSRG